MAQIYRTKLFQNNILLRFFDFIYISLTGNEESDNELEISTQIQANSLTVDVNSPITYNRYLRGRER